MSKFPLSSQLGCLKQDYEIEKSRHKDTLLKLQAFTEQLKQISAENESLRMDKKWLQQMHSNLLQSLLAGVLKP